MGDAEDTLVERLTYLRNEVSYLKQERDRVRSFQEYVENVRLKKAVERSLQVAVEACLDIGRRLIALEGFRYPEDNRDVFQVLYEEGVVPEGLLPALIDMARFRNLIVHDYARIDDAKVYGILKKRLSDFDAYARAIAAYLEQEGGDCDG
ncbi:MAG: type VII toxin-antitoxin system HepT family RNase toxin [Anaerolineae bacterium]